MSTLIKLIIAIAIGAAIAWFGFQRVLVKTQPWRTFPGQECGPGGTCQIAACRQQNNYWLDQALSQQDKRLCQKTIACINGDVQTSEFDEIDRCQTTYDTQSRQK